MHGWGRSDWRPWSVAGNPKLNGDAHGCRTSASVQYYLGLPGREEPLAIKALAAQLVMEAFKETVLPGLARLDEGRANVGITEPLHDRCSGELRAVVAADVIRHSPPHEQVAQPLQHVLAGQLPRYVDRETLPRELIHDRKHPERPTVCRPVHDEVVGPDVIPMRWP